MTSYVVHLYVYLLFDWLLLVSSLLHPVLVHVFLGFQHFSKFKGTLSISFKFHADINTFSKIALLENRLDDINSFTLVWSVVSGQFTITHGTVNRLIHYTEHCALI